MKMRLILFVLTGFLAQPLFCQNDIKLTNFGLLIDGNAGVNHSGNFDFRSNGSKGQELLGYVNRDGDFIEAGLIVGEIGFETTMVLKSGLLFKVDLNLAQTLYSDVNRIDEWALEGQWNGRGMGLGIGYAELTNREKPFFFSTALSFGTYTSTWRFANEETSGQIDFGSVAIFPEQVETFYSDNVYFDLNLKGGPTRFFRKGEANTGFNPSLSIGYRQSLNRSQWRWDKTDEIVQDINGTLMMGFYLKLCLGIGYWRRIDVAN